MWIPPTSGQPPAFEVKPLFLVALSNNLNERQIAAFLTEDIFNSTINKQFTQVGQAYWRREVHGVALTLKSPAWQVPASLKE